MWWAYLLPSFFGGVVAIVVALIALAVMARGSNIVSIQFGGEDTTFYKDVELIESGVRPGGIYVKYKNTGDKRATTACFRIKVYNGDGQLIAESEEAVFDDTAPGQTEEHIIHSHELESDWVHDPDNRIDVAFRYGYLE